MQNSQNKIALHAKETLILLSQCLENLDHDQYVSSLEILSGASIGAHSRHILELFQQLLLGYESSVINYENRKRNKSIELNIDYALETIAKIIINLEKTNKALSVSVCKDKLDYIKSNYYRELLYNIEHCVHHQAIIKIALIHLNVGEINPEFGVAKSTLEYKNNVHSKLL